MSPLTRTVAGPVTADVTGQDFTSTPNTGAVLTVVASHGSVTRDPDQATYTLGTEVTLTRSRTPATASRAGAATCRRARERQSAARDDGPGPHDHGASFVVAGRDRVGRLQPRQRDAARGGRELAAAVRRRLGQPDRANHVAGASGEALYYWQGSGTFDNARQFARATVVQAGGQVGLVLLGAPNQALVVSWNAGTLYIYWYSAGSYQGNLTTAPSTLQNGDVIEAVLDGGVVYAKINGTVVASVANTTTLTSGRPGFETYSVRRQLRRLGGRHPAVVHDQRDDHRGRGRAGRRAGDRQRRLQRQRHDGRRRRLHDQRRAAQRDLDRPDADALGTHDEPADPHGRRSGDAERDGPGLHQHRRTARPSSPSSPRTAA